MVISGDFDYRRQQLEHTDVNMTSLLRVPWLRELFTARSYRRLATLQYSAMIRHALTSGIRFCRHAYRSGVMRLYSARDDYFMR